ncbi:MAG TPA: Asp-tRNA(Asn)/Glu-tRNA(Gln) amidotransferase subunit GatB [Polyangia bacterium]|nr:Asp-tRNA(Asn)/Glu-tRNA(Gln) amidotransferase subunit GatB [Polyangia bacterium]
MSGPAVGKYEVVIGLEVHVQLATRSKVFSGSSTAFGAEPNTSTDPVCLGMPGTLPVLNRGAVEAAVRLGLAAGCTIRRRCRFSRKHYFYPDLPKGYQISQFDEPICEGGAIKFRLHGEAHSVRLTRIHMEEDAGKNLHAAAGVSFVDYNRAGVPLCEIVSEPDVRSAEEAAEYVRAVRALVRYLGIGDGNMEEGSLRCDANVSLRLHGAKEYGTKAEIKNMNSFKNVRDAVEYEIKRQATLLDRGERVAQETRLWDASRGVTQSMRSKEQAHDYRYFPEPDLPPLVVDEAFLATVRASQPELPEDRFARYTTAEGLSPQDAGVLVADRETANYFEAVVSALAAGASRAAGAAGAPAKKAANWVLNEVLARVADPRELGGANLPIPAAALAELIQLIEGGTLSGKLGKDVFARMWAERRTAADLVKAEGLTQVSDAGALEEACERVIAANPGEAGRFKENPKLMGFFVGAVMKETGGKANPKAVNEILRRLLG